MKSVLYILILCFIEYSGSESCIQQTTCAKCVEAGPSCAWCLDETVSFTTVNLYAKCNTVDALKHSNCSNIYDFLCS
uniref:Putative secreted protein n=1 Tax=Xenopsylla cheopis TaxID=163159 RepID=A0A6M2DZ36_XENCH